MGVLPKGSSSRLVSWHALVGDEERREIFQQRFAVFGAVAFVVFAAVSSFSLGMQELFPSIRPARRDLMLWFSGGGGVLLGALWWFARGEERSLRILQTIDGGAATVFGAYLGLLVYYIPDRPHNVYLPFVFNMFMMTTRVFLVPSSGWRTLLVGSAGMVPLVVGYVAIALGKPQYLDAPPHVFVAAVMLMAGVAVTVAAIGSRVMYGLRQQAREGQQLGQYTLDEKLGEGGMGTVYRASHALLRRPAAIKLLRPDRAGKGHLARFEREVQLTAQLTHPNTVAIFDYGTSPDGTFYYVMEYLGGIDLEQLVSQTGPQPAARVIHILQQACGALTEAHGRGLIHRDIKPANIILCDRGDVPDFVKVVDFGLVKELEAGTELTGTMVAGTPAYLSPEAILNHPIGPTSDLYSLGAVGYFLLTGETVFAGDTVPEVCVHHVDTEPAPPSRRTDNPIPEGLEAVVLRCLAKRPDDRFAGARELRDALLALAEADDWGEGRARAWWRGYEDLRQRGELGNAVPSQPTITASSSVAVDLRGRDL